MAHGLVFLPVLLSLAGPPEIDVGEPAPAPPPPAGDARKAHPAPASDKELDIAMTPASASTVQSA